MGVSRPRMEATPCRDNLASFFLERSTTSTAALLAVNSCSTTNLRRLSSSTPYERSGTSTVGLSSRGASWAITTTWSSERRRSTSGDPWRDFRARSRGASTGATGFWASCQPPSLGYEIRRPKAGRRQGCVRAPRVRSPHGGRFRRLSQRVVFQLPQPRADEGSNRVLRSRDRPVPAQGMRGFEPARETPKLHHKLAERGSSTGERRSRIQGQTPPARRVDLAARLTIDKCANVYVAPFLVARWIRTVLVRQQSDPIFVSAWIASIDESRNPRATIRECEWWHLS